MKVLVLGYYDRHNLGDDMFKLTIPKLIPDLKPTFLCVDDYSSETTNINDYDAVICGGGDIINDYFHLKIVEITKSFQGKIYAVGIGIPYYGLIKKGYLDIYDHQVTI